MMKARKTSYRKYILISIVIILILLIAVFSFLRCFFIFLDGKLYRKDITVIRGVNVTSNNIREINLCTKLEELDIWAANDNILSEMKAFNSLADLLMVDANLSEGGILRLNDMPQLNRMTFLESHIDLTRLNNKALTHLSISLSDVSGIIGCASCSSLTEMVLQEVTIPDKIICTKNKEYLLKDSSDFSALDNIKVLEIHDIDIEDISGFLEMDSLETLNVTQGTLSNNDYQILMEAGIIIQEQSTA